MIANGTTKLPVGFDANRNETLAAFFLLCHYSRSMIDFYTEIHKRYGHIRRTRGYFLYTEKNIRLIDFYLDGGMSILGRKAGQTNLVAKQWLDRGLIGFLPTKADYQLEKAVKTVLPDYPVIRWYHSQEKAYDILRKVLKKENKPQHKLPVWRPFLPQNKSTPLPPATFVTPVYPSSYSIIAAEQSLEAALPPSDKLFPPMMQSIARAFFDVQKKIRKEQTAEPAPKKKNTNKEKQLGQLQPLLSSFWKQEGCYLFPKISEADYPAFFSAALDAHIFISPDYHSPSILPDLEVYTECLNFFRSYTQNIS